MKLERLSFLSLGVVIALSNASQAQQVIWQIEAAKPEDLLVGVHVGPDDDGDGVAELLLGYMFESCAPGSGGVVREFSTTSGQLEQWCGTTEFGGFGSPVRWMDDVDGGGQPDIAVGETLYDVSGIGFYVGRIQVYSGETDALIYEVVGTEPNGQFGYFDLGDDVDGVGIRDLVVGSDRYGPIEEGRAWVLSGATGTEIRAHYGSGLDNRLGARVAGLGDADGDGIEDYAISAIGKQVDVYSGSNGALIRRLTDSAGNNFGIWISRCSDLDGDGLADILVSKVIGAGDGRVEAYSPITGALIWSISGLSSVEYFGRPTLEVGDQNADGVRDFLMTTIYDDHVSRDSGRVDLISGATRRPLYRFYPNATKSSYLGEILARGADFNGDDIEDLVIGTTDGGSLSKDAGLIQIRAGNDLWLQADPTAPIIGNTVIVDLRGPPAGQLGLIALIDIDGTPTFAPLLLAPFDANGELQFSADVDSSLSGMEFTLMGWAQNKKGRGPLVEATPFVVSVQ